MIAFRWNDFDFTLIQADKGVFKNNMAGHSHSKNSYELHFVVDGEGTLATDSKVYDLSKGDFFVTGPNVYHQQSTNPEKPLTEIFIYLQASEKKSKDALVSSFLSTHFYFSKDEDLQKLFEEILEEKNNKHLGYTSAVGSLLQLLLLKITRLYVPDFVSFAENKDNLNDRRFITIEHAFINDNGSLTLSELSDLIGVCERQAQRLLRKYYGKTFREKKAESLKSRVKKSVVNTHSDI